MRALGVGPGDRVVGYLPNIPEARSPADPIVIISDIELSVCSRAELAGGFQAVIAMLAAATIGASWSSCSPDFGVGGVLDRFERLQPSLLICADGYSYGGKQHDSLEKTAEILAALPSTPPTVVVPYIAPERADAPAKLPTDRSMLWSELLASGAGAKLDRTPTSFSRPHYIMFSSGTTGAPKCIVQSAGGVLINQLKEQVLQCSMGPKDNLFYYTTTGWMMWNWMVSNLYPPPVLARTLIPSFFSGERPRLGRLHHVVRWQSNVARLRGAVEASGGG